mmetsp:Transcript_53090/g.63972  ORF Transcript_53090/g.63972 Transcript_53090/m.63972 type:complete len:332 (+) Transcript_53090:152-1147(+)|eukprot:CAMPEP_0194361468 /NCGR_PEP_ID=MMETSP0174-20130528/9055_1 /TAXON_ID=216777 /ORGANISM="Proboscia alata, Strain PI-D3" /LENGTH=331 /DNA_ID=CAMNT_0039133697 /DNA_START=99 /DNA_END=1094 /DNA_ORIENTATION=+
MDRSHTAARTVVVDDTTDTFDLKALVSACIHLARRGGAIITEEHEKGQLDAHNKKVTGDTRAISEMAANEVLTVADGRAQDAIITSLRGMFPNLRIVGEEDDELVPGNEQPSTWSDVSLIEHPFDVPSHLNESLTAADVCLWVDPLDGTKEFVMGNLANVSVLIGIALRDRPVAGVILQPFVGSDGGDVTYGAIDVGVFHNRERVDIETKCPSDTIIVMSGKHENDGGRLSVAVGRLDPTPQVLSLNACGNKMLRVILGEASAHLQGPGASRWDTCAGEALLMALGGVVTSLDGIPYQYTHGICHDNANGFIASRSPELHSRLLEALSIYE